MLPKTRNELLLEALDVVDEWEKQDMEAFIREFLVNMDADALEAFLRHQRG